jgi:hypothetical protein
MQVFGLVCPFTGKIRFIEIAKNAKVSYENLIRGANLFMDPISEWINILESKGVNPGYVILDSKALDAADRKKYWEKFYNINKN